MSEEEIVEKAKEIIENHRKADKMIILEVVEFAELILKQQKQIETLESTLQGYKGLSSVIDIKQKEIEDKDKMIEEMVNALFTEYTDYEPCYLLGKIAITEKDCKFIDCKDCIKQYFERKVRDESNIQKHRKKQ